MGIVIRRALAQDLDEWEGRVTLGPGPTPRTRCTTPALKIRAGNFGGGWPLDRVVDLERDIQWWAFHDATSATSHRYAPGEVPPVRRSRNPSHAPAVLSHSRRRRFGPGPGHRWAGAHQTAASRTRPALASTTDVAPAAPSLPAPTPTAGLTVKATVWWGSASRTVLGPHGTDLHQQPVGSWSTAPAQTP